MRSIRRCLTLAALPLAMTVVIAAFAQDAPVFEPAYPDSLARGGATIEVHVRDAKGEKLALKDSTGCFARLWRLYGRHRFVQRLSYRADTSRFVHTGRSLEAGEYFLQVRAHDYGVAEKAFVLKGGEEKKVTLQMPGWRRVVKLTLEDGEGSPIEVIGGRPEHAATDQDFPTELNYASPGPVLRRSDEDPGRIGAVGLSSRERLQGRYLTADGKLYAVVVAGLPGTLTLPLGKEAFGTEELRLSSTFVGEEWDGRAVTLSPHDDYRELMANIEVLNPQDPGGELASRRPAPWDIRDVSELPDTHCRVVIRVEATAGIPVAVELRAGRHYPPEQWVSEDLRTWVFHLERDKEIRLFVTNYGQVAHQEFFHVPDRDLLEKEVMVDLPAVHFSPRSPTASAYFECRTYGDEDPARFVRGGSDYPWFMGRYLVPAVEDVLREGGTWLVVREEAQGDVYRDRIRLTDRHLATLNEKREVELPFRVGGLWFRAMDETGRAVAWAEGVLLDKDEDDVAQGMMAVERALGDRRAAPDAIGEETRKAATEDKAPTADELRRMLGERLWKDYEEYELRLRLARCGTWYNPARRLEGDVNGFFVEREPELEPGNRYVLYLWSRSRDDLKPDRRIEFIAAENETDLGAIALPSLR